MAKLRTLEKLSRDARRRMGLETADDDLDAKIAEKVADAVADLKSEIVAQIGKGGGGLAGLLISAGLKSSPSPGSKKVINLFVTTEGKLEIFYEAG